ncbi:uncharacterized protein BDR25DRAFT_380075 [Lindgomyces ingoldianus]|uniref:Uncharacterized protein n=1 Tax=Lindgomyces ingoldianus TaxID=673940 RepID=A0ACB6QDP0_9PLEO|nr:uncharacterized protein BDR25DRAFT_380075 [Lindgomyces ingoldianus]KAF2465011.1 hypothetical protein BDR25DRAFT_380075 [Lindgomyces ingoldianus]
MPHWRKVKNVTTATNFLEKKADERLNPVYVDGRVEEPPNEPPTTQQPSQTSQYNYTHPADPTGQPNRYGAQLESHPISVSSGQSSYGSVDPIPSVNGNSYPDQQPQHYYNYTNPYYPQQPQYPKQQNVYLSQPSYQEPPPNTQYSIGSQPYNNAYQQPIQVSPLENPMSSPMRGNSVAYSDASTISPPHPPGRALTYPAPQNSNLPFSPCQRSWTAPVGPANAPTCLHHSGQFFDR